MRIAKSKLSFLRRIIQHRLARQPRVCPYCAESLKIELMGRKKLILDVVRCQNCLLIFRYPMDDSEESYTYYEHEYESGATTHLPHDNQVKSMLENGFKGTGLDLGAKIKVLKGLRSSGRVLDYGSSWGYGTYQLAAHGYRAIGFEISRARAQFGREKLGVQIVDDPSELENFPGQSFDIIFTNHVLEHLLCLREKMNLFARLLADEGIMFHVLPNFSGTSARSGLFWKWIGEAHPIAPSKAFFERNLSKHGFRQVVCASGPFDDTLEEKLFQQQFEKLDIEGDELLVLAWKSYQKKQGRSPA